jgi:hypothetical protein
MPHLATWGHKSTFSYRGSVLTGTKILYGHGRSISISSNDYAALRRHFSGKKVPVDSSRTIRSPRSIGHWLSRVTGTAIATYVAAILEREGYATRFGKDILIR